MLFFLRYTAPTQAIINEETSHAPSKARIISELFLIKVCANYRTRKPPNRATSHVFSTRKATVRTATTAGLFTRKHLVVAEVVVVVVEAVEAVGEGDDVEEVVAVGGNQEVQEHQVGRRVGKWNIDGWMPTLWGLHSDAAILLHRDAGRRFWTI